AKIMIPLAIVFTVIIVPSYLASIHNSYYYGSSHIFGKGTQLGDDTAAIEEVFGKSDTYVLMVPEGDTATETKMLAEIKKLPEVSGVIAFVEQAGAEIPYEYLDEDTLNKLESENYSRMVLSVDVAYEGEETFQLVENVREIAQRFYPDRYHLAGEGVSTYDLMDTVIADMTKVNLVAIAAVAIVLLLTMKSVVLPVILVLTIETAIWINLSFPYYIDTSIFYIAYLIISAIQLGATVDYAILFTDRYQENRLLYGKKQSIVETLSNVMVSILTSGAMLTIVGFLLGKISTHGLLSQLGYLLGRGTLCSLFAVILVLPGFLYLFDRFYMKKESKKK
ncbi:MAG: MMPL family transporter, partial [Eubacteriales bacterium]|nr:MMPL family transporter [Eubacteriales bacterium]